MSTALVESNVLVWRSISAAGRPREQPGAQNVPENRHAII